MGNYREFHEIVESFGPTLITLKFNKEERLINPDRKKSLYNIFKQEFGEGFTNYWNSNSESNVFEFKLMWTYSGRTENKTKEIRKETHTETDHPKYNSLVSRER